MRIRFTSTALLACAALSGCAPARIALPSDVTANMEKLELTGMGGWQDGHFRLGASEGRFSRRATTTAILNTFVRNAGSGSFEISGPELGGSAGGRCGFEEHEIDAGVAVLPNGRLTYRCAFYRDGRPIPGGMFLTEVPHGSGLLAGITRAGDVQVGGVKLDIRPIHRLAGTSVPAGTPLGYSFDVAGRQVGAVDLNGLNKTIYAPRQPGPERDAVLMAALALSVFWDPGA
jgi:hypothetical protein